jgi:transposase
MTKQELPKDVDQCHDIILQMYERMRKMEQQISVLVREKYGRKSEVVNPGQLRIFSDLKPAEIIESTVQQQQAISVKGHGRRKPPKELPRVRQEYRLPQEQLACPGCARQRETFGEEITQQYDYVPASIQVIEHVQIKYACKHCEGHVVIAPKPKTLFEKGLATEAMMGEIATRKFADHLPLNRLEGIFKRDGVHISRSTMCDWMMAMANGLNQLYQRMVERVLQSEIIWTDDTPVRMQDRTHEKNIRNARVWAYLGDKENPFTVFDFTESRKRDGPVEFLSGFSGYLQADAFVGYDCIYVGGSVIEVACWAHARRKFFEALQTNEKACSQALAIIQRLYAVEKEAHDFSIHERYELRQEKSAPMLLEFKQWLERQKLIELPKTPTAKAITYALNNWKGLSTFLERGDLTVDNNKTERTLRAMAVGRKNWLFMGSKAGGKAATILASFVATCKQHNIHPRLYFEDVLKRLAYDPTDLDVLLPDRWQPQLRG